MKIIIIIIIIIIIVPLLHVKDVLLAVQGREQAAGFQCMGLEKF
jgi:hypothetical protein